MMRKTIVSLFAVLSGTAMLNAANFALDLRPAAPKGPTLMSAAALPGPGEVGVLRSTALGAGAAITPKLEVGDEITLALYPEVTVTLKLTERDLAPLAGNAFHAVVDDAEFCDAVVLETDDGLIATLTHPRSGRVYRVVSSPTGVLVREIDPKAGEIRQVPSIKPDLPSAAAGGTILPAQQTMLMSGGGAELPDQSSTVVDFLMAFDRPAADWARTYGGGVTNFAQEAVTRMNIALGNSSVSETKRLSDLFRFRLVGVVELDVDVGERVDAQSQGTGLNNIYRDFSMLYYALECMKNGWYGFRPINIERNEKGADIVAMMVDTGSAYGTVGLGYALEKEHYLYISEFASTAYSVSSIRSVAQSHTMTHEVGHNMGAGHADLQKSDPGPQYGDFSCGAYFTGNDGVKYHTIMAYDDDGYGGRYAEAPVFSSPYTIWKGAVAGTADKRNNAGTIELTYKEIIKFKAQKVPLSYDVFFSHESETMFKEPLTLTMTPGKAGATIRYTTDGSTPTATYGTVYTGPLLLTTSTKIKAVAVDGGVAGMVFERNYYYENIGDALDAPHLVWNNDPNYPWTVTQYDSYRGALSVRSGPVPAGNAAIKTTALTTEIVGPATVTFRYRSRMYASNFSIYLDNSTWYEWRIGGSTDLWKLGEFSVPEGRHTVKFEYKRSGSLDGFNGVWLDDVQVKTGQSVLDVMRADGGGNNIRVPFAWLIGQGLVGENATPQQAAAAADADDDGDGISNWQEYVCGTNPKNAMDKITCSITIDEDGKPVVDFYPHNGLISGYRAVLKGKANLSDPEWTPKAEGHRFFKVVVEKQ